MFYQLRVKATDAQRKASVKRTKSTASNYILRREIHFPQSRDCMTALKSSNKTVKTHLFMNLLEFCGSLSYSFTLSGNCYDRSLNCGWGYVDFGISSGANVVKGFSVPVC